MDYIILIHLIILINLHTSQLKSENRIVKMFCKCTKNKKQKYLIYISIKTLCYETLNWAQLHPVSIDHPWDVSTTWLETTSGKFNWLDMIWKGIHLPTYITSPTWQCTSDRKPTHELEGIVRRAQRQDCVEAQMLEREPKHFYSIEGP